MSNERQLKPMQRFSRYSRASYDDPAIAHSAHDLSLTEITERALKGESAPDLPIVGPSFPGLEERPYDLDESPSPQVRDFWNDAPVQRKTHNDHPGYPANDTINALLNGDHQHVLYEQPKADPTVMPPDAEDSQATNRHDEPETRREAVAEAGITTETGKQKERDSVRAVNASANALRKKAGPLLINSGMWLARNLKRREIRRRFSRLLAFGHTHLTDRKTERLFFVPTRLTERYDPAPDRGVHFDGPVPVKAFEWVMSLMPEDLREYAFIDVRAELGRTSLLATRNNIKHVIAYEYDAKHFDDLKMNIAQYPRSQMTCRNIDARRGDVDGVVIPDQPCIVYFSNAWREPMLKGVINLISESYQQHPRRIYIVLANTASDTMLDQNNIFDPVEPLIAERMKLRLLSPIDFKIYHSIA
ncbi:MAG: hypothetical protein KTR19_12935 [Hyphomicrobiales bacterium]|nr:hypothetical protein [Hyphomicrobiales bacterium]